MLTDFKIVPLPSMEEQKHTKEDYSLLPSYFMGPLSSTLVSNNYKFVDPDFNNVSSPFSCSTVVYVEDEQLATAYYKDQPIGATTCIEGALTVNEDYEFTIYSFYEYVKKLQGHRNWLVNYSTTAVDAGGAEHGFCQFRYTDIPTYSVDNINLYKATQKDSEINVIKSSLLKNKKSCSTKDLTHSFGSVNNTIVIKHSYLVEGDDDTEQDKLVWATVDSKDYFSKPEDYDNQSLDDTIAVTPTSNVSVKGCLTPRMDIRVADNIIGVVRNFIQDCDDDENQCLDQPTDLYGTLPQKLVYLDKHLRDILENMSPDDAWRYDPKVYANSSKGLDIPEYDENSVDSFPTHYADGDFMDAFPVRLAAIPVSSESYIVDEDPSKDKESTATNEDNTEHVEHIVMSPFLDMGLMKCRGILHTSLSNSDQFIDTVGVTLNNVLQGILNYDGIYIEGVQYQRTDLEDKYINIECLNGRVPLGNDWDQYPDSYFPPSVSREQAYPAYGLGIDINQFYKVAIDFEDGVPASTRNPDYLINKLVTPTEKEAEDKKGFPITVSKISRTGFPVLIPTVDKKYVSKVSVIADSEPGYLKEILTAGDNINIEQDGNKLKISADSGGTGDTYKVAVDEKDTSPDYLGSKIQGSSEDKYTPVTVTTKNNKVELGIPTTSMGVVAINEKDPTAHYLEHKIAPEDDENFIPISMQVKKDDNATGYGDYLSLGLDKNYLGQIRVNEYDQTLDYIENKLRTVDEESDFIPINISTVNNECIELSLDPTYIGKVAVSEDDKVPDYLSSKIISATLEDNLIPVTILPNYSEDYEYLTLGIDPEYLQSGVTVGACSTTDIPGHLNHKLLGTNQSESVDYSKSYVPVTFIQEKRKVTPCGDFSDNYNVLLAGISKEYITSGVVVQECSATKADTPGFLNHKLLPSNDDKLIPVSYTIEEGAAKSCGTGNNGNALLSGVEKDKVYQELTINIHSVNDDFNFNAETDKEGNGEITLSDACAGEGLVFRSNVSGTTGWGFISTENLIGKNLYINSSDGGGALAKINAVGYEAAAAETPLSISKTLNANNNYELELNYDADSLGVSNKGLHVKLAKDSGISASNGLKVNITNGSSQYLNINYSGNTINISLNMNAITDEIYSRILERAVKCE